MLGKVINSIQFEYHLNVKIVAIRLEIQVTRERRAALHKGGYIPVLLFCAPRQTGDPGRQHSHAGGWRLGPVQVFEERRRERVLRTEDFGD